MDLTCTLMPRSGPMPANKSCVRLPADRPKSHLRMDRHYKHVSKPLQAVGAPKGNQAGSPVTNGRVLGEIGCSTAR